MVVFNQKFDSYITTSLNKRAFKKLLPLFVIMSLFLIVLGILLIIDEENPDIGYGIFLIIFGLGFFPLILLLTKVIQKNVNKSMSVLSIETTETYRFYEDHFEIEQIKGDEFKGITIAKYSYFFSIEEDKDNYYLSLSKMQSHVIRKNSLIEGSIDEFINILSRNIPQQKLKINR